MLVIKEHLSLVRWSFRWLRLMLMTYFKITLTLERWKLNIEKKFLKWVWRSLWMCLWTLYWKVLVSLYTAWALRVSSGLESTLSLPRGLTSLLIVWSFHFSPCSGDNGNFNQLIEQFEPRGVQIRMLLFFSSQNSQVCFVKISFSSRGQIPWWPWAEPDTFWSLWVIESPPF